jgi:hypothetical protein
MKWSASGENNHTTLIQMMIFLTYLAGGVTTVCKLLTTFVCPGHAQASEILL